MRPNPEIKVEVPSNGNLYEATLRAATKCVGKDGMRKLWSLELQQETEENNSPNLSVESGSREFHKQKIKKMEFKIRGYNCNGNMFDIHPDFLLEALHKYCVPNAFSISLGLFNKEHRVWVTPDLFGYSKIQINTPEKDKKIDDFATILDTLGIRYRRDGDELKVKGTQRLYRGFNHQVEAYDFLKRKEVDFSIYSNEESFFGRQIRIYRATSSFSSNPNDFYQSFGINIVSKTFRPLTQESSLDTQQFLQQGLPVKFTGKEWKVEHYYY